MGGSYAKSLHHGTRWVRVRSLAEHGNDMRPRQILLSFEYIEIIECFLDKCINFHELEQFRSVKDIIEIIQTDSGLSC